VSSSDLTDASMGVDAAFVERVVERWRGATMGNKRKVADGLLGDPDKANVAPLESERALLRDAALAMRREPASDAVSAGPVTPSRSLRK